MFLTELSREELEQFTDEHGGNAELVGVDGFVEEGASLSASLDYDRAFARSAA